MHVAEAVGRALADQGVRQVFGLIGSGNFAVSNALVAAGASFVAARHENGAIMMADAYAQVTGRPVACSLHQGPGLTNAVTGLTEAAKSRTPLLVLAADTAAAAVRSNFRIDQAGLVTSVGAAVERLYGAQSAVADASRALRRTLVERRPVVLMMPLDVQAAPVDGPVVDGAAAGVAARPPSLRPVRPSAKSVAEMADVLAHARRPLILAGRGAMLANAREPLERLAEAVGGLLATSAVANGLFSGNPWALGISGGFASPLASELIASADVILGMGVALNMWTTRHGHLVDPAATVVQVDVDPAAIAAHHRVDIGVVGDVAETATAVLDALANAGVGHPEAAWRDARLAERISRGTWKHVPFQDATHDGRIDPRALSAALDDLLPEQRTVAVDSGHFMGYPSMFWRVPDASAFVFTQGFQAVGLGLASAIGAAIARPDRLTVAALGDGGALMALPEFETVARLGLRLLVVVFNDAAYGAEVHHFGPSGAPLDLVQFPDVDFAAFGRAAGLGGATVRCLDDLLAVERWLAGGAPPALVLDAKVVPTVVAEWLEEAFRGH